jgi:hypothetical protein
MKYDLLMKIQPIRLAEITLNESFPVAARISAFEALYCRINEIDKGYNAMPEYEQTRIVAAMACESYMATLGHVVESPLAETIPL